MAENPFRPQSVAPQSALETNPSLQEFCDEANARAARINADWWYRVVTRKLQNGERRQEVEKIEGHRAIELRREHAKLVADRKAAAARNPAGG